MGREGCERAFPSYASIFPRRERRPEHDVCDGDVLLRLLVHLGVAGSGLARFFRSHLWAKGTDDWPVESADVRRLFHRWDTRSSFDLIPAGFAELQAVWKCLRRREHA